MGILYWGHRYPYTAEWGGVEYKVSSNKHGCWYAYAIRHAPGLDRFKSITLAANLPSAEDAKAICETTAALS